MSDATEPAPQPAEASDADAWAKACAEDLAAEKARRRAQQGMPPGSAADELRKLVEAVADKVSSFQTPLLGMAAQGAARQLINQAKSAVEPVIERNPDVIDHLAAAGGELLAAYRSAVAGREGRWTRGPEGSGKSQGPPESQKPQGHKNDDGEGPPSGEHIDLD
ncbi:DUF5304 domain-containing protein [Streptomyces sp. 21So2-11]|uniref:DUF5304 domain-containing protein n=1 Tax=Streptomyces sp. 21So2-11 TaxID=3144408 RepID=UPI00321A8C23